jgi:hypothetical protein
VYDDGSTLFFISAFFLVDKKSFASNFDHLGAGAESTATEPLVFRVFWWSPLFLFALNLQCLSDLRFETRFFLSRFWTNLLTPTLPKWSKSTW